ncbi:MAG: hypothetical protein LBT36_00405 [Oscillospiraceae bacterium]|jgi:CobQ-like glutamine amidotransferase family enzyme|nr:hypothetical protein [Oscillospiraceae bacterium]
MRIELLYPDIAGIFGDAMNVEYLRRATGAEVIRTPHKRAPAFASGDGDGDAAVDLVYLGAMTESSQALAITALLPYKDALRARIASGAAILLTGNAPELLCDVIEDEDGGVLPGLGILPARVKRMRPARYNALYHGLYTSPGTAESTHIVGFNSRFSHTYGADNAAPLFETLRGAGRNPGTTLEGFRVNNLMATYLLGPLLILNPPFTRLLLKALGAPAETLPYEAAAMDAYNARLAEFTDPKRGFTYG